MKRKEHDQWEREQADVVYGYDEFERPGRDDQ
jgi:hypothetical protein